MHSGLSTERSRSQFFCCAVLTSAHVATAVSHSRSSCMCTLVAIIAHKRRLLFIGLLALAALLLLTASPRDDISMASLSTASAPLPTLDAVATLPAADIDALLVTLGDRFAAAGQGHVVRWVPELSPDQRRALAAELLQIRVEHVARDFAVVQAQRAAEVAAQEAKLKGDANGVAAADAAAPLDSPVITPFPASSVSDLSSTPEATRAEWTARGLTLLAEGKVAALLMAGGQGTRLGSSHPKGCFDVGLISGASLFQLQAERLQRLRQLTAAHTNRPLDSVHIRWYVMTSLATHGPTVSFFSQHKHFGLPKEDIYFFRQSELPALDGEGKILMEEKHRVALAPNGNGGIFEGLQRQGALADMEKHGIAHIHVYGVDNVLVRVGDPLFVGWAVAQGADCANKVVLKDSPQEKVGVMALRGGRPSVVEYSELSAEMAQARDGASGRLLYSAGNIVQHYFSYRFLKEHVDTPLAYHVAHKAIAHISSATGERVAPKQPNGVKLEMFVFDAFERAQSMRALAVSRGEEFSAVKNAAAPGVGDSPATARRDLSLYHCALLRAAGVELVEAEPSASNAQDSSFTCACEISPLVSYAGEGLERLKGKRLQLPVYITQEYMKLGESL